MKKLLTITAIVALSAACTKSAVMWEDDREIGFFPVNGQVTKAGGPVNGTTYPTEVPFGVFAYHKVTAETAWANFQADSNPMSTYIKDGKFVNRNGTNFGGATPYYWPKTGLLAFAGYSPYKDAFTATSVSYDNSANPGLKIEGFTQGTYNYNGSLTNETIDLLWFDVDDADNVALNTPTTPVPVKFNHACTWIDFELSAKDDDSSDKFKIEEITLTNIYTKGDFSSVGTAASWTVRGETSDITLYSDATTGTTLTTTASKFSNLLIIPQAIAEGEASKVIVKYRQLTTGDPVLETLELDLKVTEADQTWIAGRHYTYQISFSLNEILIAPAIGTEWTTDTVTLN